jgi:hypothetical protein
MNVRTIRLSPLITFTLSALLMLLILSFASVGP